MNSVEVDAAGGRYGVVIGHDILTGAIFDISESSTTTVLITEETIDGLYGSWIEDLLCERGRVVRLVVPAGEASKSLSVANSLIARMAELKVRRNDHVVTLGGGMISDLGGFVASIYMRGLPVIHIPTTLLGQVDASIGGKTAVNLPEGKNLVGTFYQPRQVLCDVNLLKSLPDREFNSGLAEVIKYALCFDRGLTDLLLTRQEDLKRRESELLEGIVSRCARIKAEIVSEDDRDDHRRLLLNYGHTLGHALEALGGYERVLHGEAISVGMVCAANLAEARGYLDADTVQLHLELLSAFDLPVRADFLIEDAIRLIAMDKKNLSVNRWVLLGRDGPEVVEDISKESIEDALQKVGGSR